jgi:hypothetical protein
MVFVDIQYIEDRRMSKPAVSHAALPIAHLVLRILVVGNWAMAGGILALLFVLPNREWIMAALKLDPSLEADRVVMGLRAIAGIGLVVVTLNYGVLRHLLAIVHTVREGDPFAAMNAGRLRTIAWILLTLQLVGMVISAVAGLISTPTHPVRLDAGFSTNGWLAVILTFVLARVFEAGTRMRDDLEGTV